MIDREVWRAAVLGIAKSQYDWVTLPFSLEICFYIFKIFIYLFLAVLCLCCCVGFSLSGASGGSSLVAVCMLLIVVASLAADYGP